MEEGVDQANQRLAKQPRRLPHDKQRRTHQRVAVALRQVLERFRLSRMVLTELGRIDGGSRMGVVGCGIVFGKRFVMGKLSHIEKE